MIVVNFIIFCYFLLQIALATFLLNISVLNLKRDDELGISVLANVVPDIITNIEDPEAQFRAYTALGTLITSGNQELTRQVKLKVLQNVQFIEKLKLNASVYQNDVELKRKNCALQIQNLVLN